MKKTLLFTMLISGALHAQLVYNNDQQIFINTGAIVFVQNGDVENVSGSLDNEGLLLIEGSFINNGTASGGGLSSKYQLTGDWENNDVFTAQNSLVELNGTNQKIEGTQETSFYNLSLETGGVKSLYVNANVLNRLDLNDYELDCRDFKMHVLNPAVQAIVFNDGFVSTNIDGRLVRSTNVTAEYIYPLGDNVGGVKFRPLLLSPSSADSSVFEAAMLYESADNYAFNTSSLDVDVQAVNPYFFHLLGQTSGAGEAKVSLLWDTALEGSFDEIAEWDGGLWKSLYQDGNGTAYSLDYLSKSTWQDNGNEPLILATKKGDVSDLYGIPNAFAPNGLQSENTTFGIINQKGLVNLVSMQIFDRWGVKVFDNQREGVDTWDGYYEGKLQNNGNYTYLINLEKINGEAIPPITGNFLLIW